MRSVPKHAVIGLTIALFCASLAFGSDFYVSEKTGNNGNSGLAPDDAWHTITYALEAVTGTAEDPATIHIAAGLYSYGSNGEILPLRMKSYMTLQGAGAGLTELDAFTGPSGPFTTQDGIIMAQACEDAGVVGVSLLNGSIYYAEFKSGGGVYCVNSSLLIDSCLITNCSAEMGAAVFIGEGSDLRIRDTLITLCSAGVGTAIYAESSSLSADGCTIANNWGERGIGLWCVDCDQVNLQNCIIRNNRATYAAPGLYFHNCSPVLSNCVISENSGNDDSSGVYCDASTAVFHNCLIARNGIRCFGGSLEVVDCTIADNLAAIWGLEGASIDVVDSILWGNGDEVLLSGESSLAMNYSCIEGGVSHLPVSGGEGVIDLDPCFAATSNGDYFLSSIQAGQPQQSPCIDAGSTASEARNLAKLTTRTDGEPDSGVVDMGYHYPSEGRKADIYVDPDAGDDANSGASPEEAYRRLTFAVSSASGLSAENVTIYLAEGKYSPSANGDEFPVTAPPQPGSVAIIGASQERTVLDAETSAETVISLSRTEKFSLANMTIQGGARYGVELLDHAAAMLNNCTITLNQGPGVYFDRGAMAMVNDCTITSNMGTGLMLNGYCFPVITGCVIAGNIATHGGGVYCGPDAYPSISNCLITGNYAVEGGGVYCYIYGRPSFTNCTIADNSAGSWGAFYVSDLYTDGSFMTNCIVWGNGQEPTMGGHFWTTSNSCIEGASEEDWFKSATACFDADPLFVSGPLGDYYLSSVSAGQAVDSPCIDTGSDTAQSRGLDGLTTRTDGEPDGGVADMGYHYPLPGAGTSIRCFLNDTYFTAGDLLVGSLEVSNQGPEVSVDIYVGFITPDGDILSFTGASFASGLAPLVTNQLLPTGFSHGPEALFELVLPANVPRGHYAFGAALMRPGEYRILGQMSSYQFNIGE
ncbi:MAG: right-handed parallel beta-helix repeat-containing protein [Candidatus Coatesbacteria bacterium]|nr:right-handed parallel beta-helix repeat-containing protein [Candidatus Coatesbacteria bacterium]